MKRTQIQLTEAQARALKRLAGKKHVSIASLIRESVDDLLRSEGAISREELVQRSLEAVGKYRSGKGDISVRHDDYLAEAYSGQRRRPK